MFLNGEKKDTGVLELERNERMSLLGILDPFWEAIRADIAMISYLSPDYHHIAVARGFELPPEAKGRADLSSSICRHAVAMDFLLVVDDALSHPLLRENLTVAEFGIASYLGAPIHFPGRRGAVGTVCAMHRHPRRWQTEEIERVIRAAESIDRLLEDWDATA